MISYAAWKSGDSHLFFDKAEQGASGEIADEAQGALPNIDENLRVLSGGKRR